MADYAQKFTDAQAEALSKQIAKIYAQAAREIKKKLDSFRATHDLISKKMLKQVEDGIITKKEYQQWLQSQVFQGELWEKKLKDITNVYVNADAKAREILGGTSKNVFAEAANFTAYSIAKDFGSAVSFGIYNKHTVERLLKDNPKLLPEWKINEKKDYIWNYERVNNAITQGIIQGESVYDIGKRLYKDLSASNASKMDMFARTAVTGAQNAGRVNRMQEADEEYGLKSKKQWVSSGDNRVRDTHKDLDGVTVNYDESFIVPNDGRKIDYPGDPFADPDLVYNCRCSLIYITPHSHGDFSRKAHMLPEYETYNKWKTEMLAKEGN